MSESSSFERQITIGAGLMIAMRWLIRFMGLISTVILARLLMPEDFGIVAMAMVFQALMESMLNLNVELSLIRNQQADKADYDTAWTIGIMQFGSIGLLLFAAAGLAAEYYDEARLEAVIQVLALAISIRGLVNIGVVDFRKELKFDRELKYTLIFNGLRVLATIGFAFWLRSYWAMVLGILTGSIAQITVSYLMSTYRPRLSLARWRAIMGVSAGVWLVNMTRFAGMQADRLILGKLVPLGGLGGYSLAVDLARMPSSELILPLSRAMVPGYAKVKHDLPRMGRLFRSLLQVTALFGAPIAFGFPLIAEDFTQIILGEKWAFIVPMLEIAAILAVIELLSGTNRPFLLAAGSIKRLNIVLVLETALLLGSIYPAYQWGEVQAVLLVMVGIRLVGLLALNGLSAATAEVGFFSLLQPLLRPVLSGVAMMVVLVLTEPQTWSPYLRMPFMLLIGAVTYFAAVFVFWQLAGKPSGPEAKVIEKLATLRTRIT